MSRASTMMALRWPLQLVGVVLLALVVGVLFLQEPGFGDDLTYWSFAFDLHERGLVAWQRASFHDLRWPVWGICWLAQAVAGPGLLSFYGEPLFYLAAGAALSFAFGKMLTRSLAAAWACGIAFLFHPLLDTVCYRPMPDLSEGVWGAAVMLCWWLAMRAEVRTCALLFSALTGAAVFVLESNRITGVFIVPVLALATLLFFPRRFPYLVAAGAVAAVLYLGEACFYQRLFGDWLHNLHANLGNKGAKGIFAIAPWALPFRFFDSLWKGNPLAPAYCIFALGGIWVAWRARGHASTLDATLGRAIVLWFVVLYLEYACAPQSFKGGWNPLIRDADRFLCGLVVPMSVLAALGFTTLLGAVAQRWPHTSRPVVAGVLCFALLALVTSRARFDLGFVPEMRRTMATLPDATKVFTHKAMREIAFLVDASSARRFTWLAPNEILHRDPALEAMAAQADQFWFARKLVWLTTRKKLEKKSFTTQPPLGSYFDSPEREWVLTQVLARGNTPDLVFSRRRTAASPAPLIIPPDSPELRELMPPLPLTWAAQSDQRTSTAHWKVPEGWRGKLVRLEVIAASPQVEAFTARVLFATGNGKSVDLLLKPYLYPQPGKEFFSFRIPPDVLRAELHLKYGSKTTRVEFHDLRFVLESASD